MFSSNYFSTIRCKQLNMCAVGVSSLKIKLKNCKEFELLDIFINFGRSTILRNSEPQNVFKMPHIAYH